MFLHRWRRARCSHSLPSFRQITCRMGPRPALLAWGVTLTRANAASWRADAKRSGGRIQSPGGRAIGFEAMSPVGRIFPIHCDRTLRQATADCTAGAPGDFCGDENDALRTPRRENAAANKVHIRG